MGKYRCSSSRIKRNFWRRCRGYIINIYQVPNHKSHILAIYIIFHLLLFSHLLNQKYKILCCTLFYLKSIYRIYYNFLPFNTWVASICYLCAGAIHVVLRGSPTGSITLVSSLREIPTIAVLHHPFLFGEKLTRTRAIKKGFLAPLPGRHHQHLLGS